MKKHILFLALFALQCLTMYAQQIKISGVVTDESNYPLPGAAVSVVGTGSGTTTDLNGEYTIQVTAGNKLQFSYIGYDSQTIAVDKSKTKINVTLYPKAEALDELVVVGYGVQKKVNLTGSVSTVNFDQEMSSRPITNASSAMAGLSAGVQVQQSSGKPGSQGATIRVRGLGTMNSNNPLVLVDGIEWDMNNVNTEDIASITVLKDAASAAIYGSRAANGVILVTTKKGEGKTKVNYSFYASFLEPQNKLKLVSDYARHMELINEGCDNMDKAHVFGDATIEAWREAQKNPNGTNEYGMPNYMAYPNTDWFSEIMGTGFSQKHNMSVSGSSDKAKYFLSLGYYDTDGIMNKKGMNSGQEQFQFRANIEMKVNNWLSIGTRLNGLKEHYGLTNVSRGFEYLSITTPGVYPGETNKWGQPAATEESTNANNIFYQMARSGYDKKFRGNFTLYGIITPMKGLSIEASYNYAPDWLDYATWGIPNGQWNYVTNESVSESALENASIYNSSYKRTRKNSEILARYNTTIAKDHDLGVLAGFTTSYLKESSFTATRKGMADWGLTLLNTATELNATSSSETDWALISYFGRLNYAFKGRYLFEANVRYDGSSRFSPESRWGLFPSFSAGWRINEEKFMSFAKDYLSNLKIRASWGKMGNNASGNYDWQASYATNKVVLDGTPTTGMAVTKQGNSALEWETTTTTNIGIDFGFFNNRLSGEVEWYNKLTSGILFTPTIPLTMGKVTGATENIAKVRNNGIEFSLAWQDRIKDFTYKIGGNFSFNKNKVVKYKGKLDKHWEYDENGNPTTFYSNYGDVAQSGFNGVIVEGRMLGEYYIRDLYHGDGSYTEGKPDINAGPKDGMIRTESDMAWVKAMIADGYTFKGVSTVSKSSLWYGDLIYADANGDGDYGDTHDLNFTGTSSMPKYNFGFNLSAAYKGFDFYMLWAGCAGFDLYWNHAQYNGTETKNGYGISERVANNHYFYNPENPDDARTNINALYPSLTDNTQRANNASSTFWLYKGDYIKLKNVQVGYTLPTNLTKKFFVEKLRLYVSGENLWTITDFPGLDPELGTSVTYPLTRQFAFGVQLSL